MNDEAEKAAKWDAQQAFKSKKERLTALEHEMEKLGNVLANLSYGLRHPHECAFRVDRLTLTVARQQERDSTSVERAHLDWDSVSRLIADYLETQEQVAKAQPKFPDIR